MSLISERVRVALYDKLNVSTVLDLATGGVYHDQAPPQASFPYVTFTRIAPGAVDYNFSNVLNHEDDLWLIKAFADEDSDPEKSPYELIQEILIAAETAIGNSLDLSAGETWLCQRFADVILPKEDVGDRVVFASGFNLRVVAVL